MDKQFTEDDINRRVGEQNEIFRHILKLKEEEYTLNVNKLLATIEKQKQTIECLERRGSFSELNDTMSLLVDTIDDATRTIRNK